MSVAAPIRDLQQENEYFALLISFYKEADTAYEKFKQEMQRREEQDASLA